MLRALKELIFTDMRRILILLKKPQTTSDGQRIWKRLKMMVSRVVTSLIGSNGIWTTLIMCVEGIFLHKLNFIIKLLHLKRIFKYSQHKWTPAENCSNAKQTFFRSWSIRTILCNWWWRWNLRSKTHYNFLNPKEHG